MGLRSSRSPWRSAAISCRKAHRTAGNPRPGSTDQRVPSSCCSPVTTKTRPRNAEAPQWGAKRQTCRCLNGVRRSARAQLFGFRLLGTLETVVRLHEKKPRALTIAHLARFFQIRLCLGSQRFHNAHATPPSLSGVARGNSPMMAKSRNAACVGRVSLWMFPSGCSLRQRHSSTASHGHGPVAGTYARHPEKMLRHSGRGRRPRAGIHSPGPVVMDSGLGTACRPGMRVRFLRRNSLRALARG
jgi:hypothetical protein